MPATASKADPQIKVTGGQTGLLSNLPTIPNLSGLRERAGNYAEKIREMREGL